MASHLACSPCYISSYPSRLGYVPGLIWQGMPAWELHLLWGELERVTSLRVPAMTSVPTAGYTPVMPRVRVYDPPLPWESRAEREARQLQRQVEDLEWRMEDLRRAVE